MLSFCKHIRELAIEFTCFYIPVAGFDAIFDWYVSTLGRFFNLHIVKPTTCHQSCKGMGFLFFILTFTSHFTL